MKLIWLMIAGLLLSSALVWAAQPQDYTLTYVHQEPKMTVKYYLQDDLKLRIDYLSPNGTAGMSRIFRKDKGLVWTLYSFSKQYQEQPFEPGAWDMVKGGFTFEWDKDKCQKIGETKLLNYPCEIRQLEKGGKTTIAYIAQGMNVVLKAENKENDKTMLIMEATDFRLGKAAATLFEIPAGYVKP